MSLSDAAGFVREAEHKLSQAAESLDPDIDIEASQNVDELRSALNTLAQLLDGTVPAPS